jgi:hypothetical protein
VRERFDAGTGLVGIGAVGLLVSLFIDWYRPGGDGWAVFESVDLLLAAAAICALLAMAPRLASGGLGRALPIISSAALAVVVVQLVSKPPAARGSEIATGGWLALAATALMAVGSLLAAASISVTVDVRGRERRRRTAAIDAREGAAEAAEEPEPAVAPTTRRRFRRDEPLLERREPAPEAPAPDADHDEPAPDPDRTQTFDPVEPAPPTPKEP